MRKILLLLILAVFLSGCASLNANLSAYFNGYPNLAARQTYVKNRPGLSEQTKADILVRVVRIGMTKEQVLMARGSASDINRTVTKYGVNEQWVYGGCGQYICNYQYFYFENGVLTSWQD